MGLYEDFRDYKVEQRLNYLQKNWQKEIIVVPTVKSRWKKRRKHYLYNGTIKGDERLREILKNEIVIEFDRVTNGVGRKMVVAVAKQLDKDMVSYEVYDHEGKSPHIHIFIKGLEKLNDADRRVYKKNFIKHYVPIALQAFVDFSLTGEHLVALEFMPHWKHGVEKKLVKGTESGTNTLERRFMPLEIIIKQQKAPKVHVGIRDLSKDKFVNYALNNKIFQGMRNKVLFKNIAIALNNVGASKEQTYKIAKRVGENCVGRNPDQVVREILAWKEWSLKNKAFNYNVFELERFMKMQEKR